MSSFGILGSSIAKPMLARLFLLSSMGYAGFCVSSLVFLNLGFCSKKIIPELIVQSFISLLFFFGGYGADSIFYLLLTAWLVFRVAMSWAEVDENKIFAEQKFVSLEPGNFFFFDLLNQVTLATTARARGLREDDIPHANACLGHGVLLHFIARSIL